MALLVLTALLVKLSLGFCPQPAWHPPTPTRLYQDSVVLQQWWKFQGIARSTTTFPNRHLLKIPNTAAIAANTASRIRRRKHNDDERAPGWGAFCWDDVDDENGDALFLSSDKEGGSSEHTINRTITSKKHRKNDIDEDMIIFTRRNTTRPNTTRTTSVKSRTPTLVLPSQTKRSDILTVAALEAILIKNNLLMKVASSNTQTVAFPQPSHVSDQSLQYGRTFAASILGLLVGASVLPNLWLIGSIMGAYYGYTIPSEMESPHFLASAISFLGERTARFVLWWHDAIVSILFLYKTGQLSYQYYKAYAAMDQRWGVQSKIDAWNARFVSGKQKFDAWEKNNEIGRKTLAILRTAWLVEEKQRSRYRQRLVRFSKKTWKRLQGDQLVVAVASAVAIGIVWSVLSAPVAMILALGMGAIWPTWLTEWLRLLRNSNRLSTITIRSTSVTTRKDAGTSATRHPNPTRTSRIQRVPTRQMKPPRVHFYRSINGQKRYYRTAQPMWPWQRQQYQRPPRWKFWLR